MFLLGGGGDIDLGESSIDILSNRSAEQMGEPSTTIPILRETMDLWGK